MSQLLLRDAGRALWPVRGHKPSTPGMTLVSSRTWASIQYNWIQPVGALKGDSLFLYIDGPLRKASCQLRYLSVCWSFEGICQCCCLAIDEKNPCWLPLLLKLRKNQHGLFSLVIPTKPAHKLCSFSYLLHHYLTFHILSGPFTLFFMRQRCYLFLVLSLLGWVQSLFISEFLFGVSGGTFFLQLVSEGKVIGAARTVTLESSLPSWLDSTKVKVCKEFV